MENLDPTKIKLECYLKFLVPGCWLHLLEGECEIHWSQRHENFIQSQWKVLRRLSGECKSQEVLLQVGFLFSKRSISQLFAVSPGCLWTAFVSDLILHLVKGYQTGEMQELMHLPLAIWPHGA